MIWLNGTIKDEDLIPARDRGFLLGDGLFETIFVRDAIPGFLTEHLDRMREGLAALSIEVPLDEDGIAAAIRELCHRQGREKGLAAARLTVTRGVGRRGLQFPSPDEVEPMVLLTVANIAEPDTAPAELIVSRYRRAETSVLSRYKTVNYIDNLLAANEARAAGVDDALMLNGAGKVACASAANIFVMARGGELITPRVDDGALPGIVRGELLKCAGALELSIREGDVLEETIGDRPIILTNSLRGLRPAGLKRGPSKLDDKFLELFKILTGAYEARLNEDLAQRAVL